MSNNSVGSRIKARRKQLRLTLKDISDMINISVSFLSDIENNRSNPSLERLTDIAKALNTTTSYLLGDEEKKGTTLSLDPRKKTSGNEEFADKLAEAYRNNDIDLSSLPKDEREELIRQIVAFTVAVRKK